MKNAPVILVTRSGSQGAELCRELQACGIAAVQFAPIALAGPDDPVDCRRQLLSALPCQRLIVPSAEALRQGVDLVGIERLAGMPLIVPGSGTARTAREMGFADVVHPPSGGTSEDILQLPSLQGVKGLRILVLAAAGGRREIGRELIRRGATVERLHVYRRLRQPLPSGLESRLLGCSDPVTLLASGGALAALEAAFSAAAWAHLLHGLMIAPSIRVATLARAAGGERVEAAGGADHAAMLRALAKARSDMEVCGTLQDLK